MKRREFVALIAGAALQPATTWAQQPAKIHRIALIHPSLPPTRQTGSDQGGPGYRAFFSELQRLGYIEGKNLLVERYSGEGRIDQYGELARMVAQRNPDVIFVLSSRMAQHLKAATNVIPIVGFMAVRLVFNL